jgi:hypothetical protein
VGFAVRLDVPAQVYFRKLPRVHFNKNKIMNRSSEEVSKIFENVRALILGGHFVYTFGKHGSAYVNNVALYPYTALVSIFVHTFWQRSF